MNQIIETFVLALFLLSNPLFLVVLGERIVYLGKSLVERRFVIREFTRFDAPGWSTTQLIVIGLIFQIVTIFFLRFIHCPWSVAVCLPFAPALFAPRSFLTRLRSIRVPADLNFVLWTFVVMVLGTSIIQATNGITTRWTNNYGDLPFHLGMITSFLFGDNTLPEYHIFPGQILSYPFFVNIWSAALWWVAPRLDLLAMVFFYQWVLLWTLLYFLINGQRFCLLPWAVLFGGGSLWCLGENSGALIEKGAPWASMLTTIWVPQRSAMLGAVIVLAALHHFIFALSNGSRRSFALAGILLAFAPLMHTHFALVTILFCGVTLFLRALICWVNKDQREQRIAYLNDMCVYALCLLPSLLFLPWLLGKSSIVSFMWGWYPGNPLEDWHKLLAAVQMWGYSATIPLGLFVLYWIMSRQHVQLVVLTMLFLAANFVRLAYWEWDQLKLFIGMYLVLLALWAHSGNRWLHRFHYLLLLFIIPTVYELVPSISNIPPGMKHPEGHGVYTLKEVRRAEQVEILVRPTEVIACFPRHNSIVTLTGRRLFAGYLGTLSSHGISYGPREEVLNDLQKIKTCRARSVSSGEVCPDYVLWTEAEQEMWKQSVPGAGFEATAEPYLYRVKG